MAFHPREPFAYVINELSSSLTSLHHDTASGTFHVTGTVSTLPAGYTARSACADVHVHPNGRFLYGSNRGHDSIVVAEIAPGTGGLRVIQHHPTGGSWPRNFALSPDGRFLLVENQRSGNIVTLAVDPTTGRLSGTGNVLKVPAPVCLIFSFNG
jgi:6-phosphogluconolactonase